MKSRAEVVQENRANLIFNVSPTQALIYIDDRLIGSARDFGYEENAFGLVSGFHMLRIEYPGYKTFENEIEVVAKRRLHFDIELKKQP